MSLQQAEDSNSKDIPPYGYYLCSGESIEELEKFVNTFIADGWTPLGAPVFARKFSDTCLDLLVQAMVKATTS